MSKMDQSLRESALQALNASNHKSSASHPALARLNALGTELWLDTGNLEDAVPLWHSNFTALTTNNTLVNQVIQTGALDDMIREAVRMIPDHMSEQEQIMELGFAANCHTAFRLIRAFGVRVSVELHPHLAEDIDRTVSWAMRYFAVCPERFIIKIPLTPEGYCAVARLRANGIPVNYTLGFSARQNYLAAGISNPTYCNVFLGRLNAVVTDNKLGDGRMVGEKATLATQKAIDELQSRGISQTKLIAASMRSSSQMLDLAGTDVFTIPPKVAADYLENSPPIDQIVSRKESDYAVSFRDGVDTARFDVLWDVPGSAKKMCRQLAEKSPLTLTAEDIRKADTDYRVGLFHRFTNEEKMEIREYGKIPDLLRWAKEPGIALDDLMTRSALESFEKDQSALDGHLLKILQSA
jgi:transaldolase